MVLESAEEKGIEKAKVDIARNMLKNGIDVSMVVDMTGLSVDAIEKIRL